MVDQEVSGMETEIHMTEEKRGSRSYMYDELKTHRLFQNLNWNFEKDGEN